MNEKILNNKRAAVLTLGCKVNQYESDAMERLLEAAGCRLVDFSKEADIYIINTCSVTNMADRKSRQMLHRAKKINPGALVVAVGCYVQAEKEHVLEDDAVDLILGNNKKKNIVQLLEEYYRNRPGADSVDCFQDISQNAEYEELTADSRTNMTRAYVKVQDGCNQFCSYCIIPYVRGRIRSRDYEDTVAEVQKLAENGYKEIILTGIHLSSYGLDWKHQERSALGRLISLVSEVDGIERVRLGSLEPGIITGDFLDRLKENEKFCPHFHLSLQSGCSETLKRMNRRYTIEEYMEKCQMIRSRFTLPAITTDVIVGFPGESEEEFQATVAHLEQLKLYEMHIFKFSPRKGTAAARMEGQVSEQVKAKRSEILLEMSKRHQEAYESAFIGKALEVLVEEQVNIGGSAYYSGHTKNYIKVLFPSEYDVTNRLVTVVYDKPYSRFIEVRRAIR